MGVISEFLYYAKNHRILISPETRKIGICSTLIGWALIAFSMDRFLPTPLNFVILFASGCVFLFIISLFNGLDFLMVKESYSHLPHYTQKSHLPIRERKWILFWRGLIASVGYMLFGWARTSIGIIDNSAVFSTDSIMYAVLMWVILKEHINKETWLGILIASFGVSYIFFFDFQFSSWVQAFGGLGEGFLSSIALAIIILMNTVIVQHEPPTRIAFYQCLIGLCASLIFLFIDITIHDSVYSNIKMDEIFYSISAGVIYAIALIFFFAAFLFTEPLTISVLGYALTPLAGFLGWIIVGTELSKNDWISFAFITLGGGIVLYFEGKREKLGSKISTQPVYTSTLSEKMRSLKEQYFEGKLNKYDYMSQRHEYNKILFQYSDELQSSIVNKIEIMKGSLVFYLESSNIKIECDRGCRAAPFEILNFGTYEFEELEFLCQLIKNGDVIFDLGAHIGWYSINFAKKFPNSTVYSFEPIPETFKYLKNNVLINEIKNVKLNNFGFYNKNGEENFHYFKGGSAISSLINLINHEKTKLVPCVVKKLDDFCESIELKKMDALKIDIEGSELAALQGGYRTIENLKSIIYIEICKEWCEKFGYLPGDILSLLESLGYLCFILSKGKLIKIKNIENSEDNFNYFFLHFHKHKLFIEKYETKMG